MAPNWVIPKDTARSLVTNGTKVVGKSVQTTKPIPSVPEETIALVSISSGWSVASGGGYAASGVILGAGGNATSGTITVYAPTAASSDGLPSTGKKIHAAKVNGRWEMIQGGSGGGGDVNIYAGAGISVSSPEYTISNAGVLSLTIQGNSYSATGNIPLDSNFFKWSGTTLSLDYRVIRGEIDIQATKNSNNEVVLTFAIVNVTSN